MQNIIYASVHYICFIIHLSRKIVIALHLARPYKTAYYFRREVLDVTRSEKNRFIDTI